MSEQSIVDTKDNEGLVIDSINRTIAQLYPLPLLRMTIDQVCAMPLMHLKFKLVDDSTVIFQFCVLNDAYGYAAYSKLRTLCLERNIETWELDMMLPVLPRRVILQ